jgi:hypothetical protein
VSDQQKRGRPPDLRGGGPTPEAANHHPNTIRHHPNGFSHRSVHQPAIGRYAIGWCDGFTAGAVDALRCVGRELPPETWHIVETVCDRYAAVADG